MNSPYDDPYLTWLYAQIAHVKARSRARSFWRLCEQLYTTEFVWFVPNDDNRVEDGRDLRYEFRRDTGIEPDDEWMNLGCSFLEMLIGVARRLAFMTDGDSEIWFWHIMQNLNLHVYHDASRPFDAVVEDIINRVIWRTYEPSGRGGLFPLRHADKDQTDVEIWYQMCAYVLENT